MAGMFLEEKLTACTTKPINRDDFMRLGVRFTNIKMIMIEEGFCKNVWTSDIKRTEAFDNTDRKGRVGNLNTLNTDTF